MPTFYIPEGNKDNKIISISDTHHLVSALRVHVGEVIGLCDRMGHISQGRVMKIGKEVELLRISPWIQARPPFPIHLFVSLLKKEKLEWIVEKAVELNIAEVHFVLSKYSVRTELSDHKWKRLEKIVESAITQCGRAYPLKLHPVLSFEAAITANHDLSRLICHEQDRTHSLKNLFQQASLKPPYSLWIGPEGGWDKTEMDLALNNGFQSVSLGNLILKAETAALFAMSSLITLL